MDYQGNSPSGQWRARQPARAAARYDSLSISEGEEKKIRRGVSWMGHGVVKYRRRVGRRAFSFSLETTRRTGQKRATNRGPARVMPVPARDQREIVEPSMSFDSCSYEPCAFHPFNAALRPAQCR